MATPLGDTGLRASCSTRSNPGAPCCQKVLLVVMEFVRCCSIQGALYTLGQTLGPLQEVALILGQDSWQGREIAGNVRAALGSCNPQLPRPAPAGNHDGDDSRLTGDVSCTRVYLVLTVAWFGMALVELTSWFTSVCHCLVAEWCCCSRRESPSCIAPV